MKKEELKMFLIRKGWKDTRYAPPEAVTHHKYYLKTGGSGIYIKELIPFRRLKLLKTSVRVEVREFGKWDKVVLVYYKDLHLDPETDVLYKMPTFALTLH